MSNKLTIAIISLLALFLLLNCNHQDEEEEIKADMSETLPMNNISLMDVSEFKLTGENWKIANNIQSNYDSEADIKVIEGKGVLFNQPSSENNEQIITNLEHADIELKFEFLLPKGSSSAIYFHSRYELPLIDAWHIASVNRSNYPKLNSGNIRAVQVREDITDLQLDAAFAPGLWQEYHVLFRAPKFDSEGNKIQNAKFEWIRYNGKLVGENIELTGVSESAIAENEVRKASLMFKGDGGSVAYRNIRYKTYSEDQAVNLNNLTYKVFEYNGDRVPDFDTLSVIKEGSTDSLNVAQLSPKEKNYAIQFNGDLDIPVSGEYLFESQISNGGNLYVDDELVLPNNGDIDDHKVSAIIYLEKGIHDFYMSYFQIQWGNYIALSYEGPGMEKRALASRVTSNGGREPEPLFVQPASEKAERIGGFLNYNGEKRTHVLSVGNPEKIHYGYDLNRAALLALWKGPFADVTKMWVGRGIEQLLTPLNAAIEDKSGIPIVNLESADLFENQKEAKKLIRKHYSVNESGRPVFEFGYDDVVINDEIFPSDDFVKLNRRIQFSSPEPKSNLALRLAQGTSIELISEDRYRIDGRYYLEIENSESYGISILEKEDQQMLYIPVLNGENSSVISYQYVW